MFHLESKQYITQDYTKQFDNFRRKAFLSNDELNIEGLIIGSDNVLFFQRGNSINASNGIFILDKINSQTVKIVNLNSLKITFVKIFFV